MKTPVGMVSRAAVVEVLAWWVLLTVFYLASLTTAGSAEVGVSFGLGLACAMLAAGARRATGARWRLRVGWARWVSMLPVTVVADTVRVFALLARPARLRAASGRLRELTLPCEPEPVSAGRVAVGGVLLSATPGSYVVDDDPGQRRMTVHVLAEGAPSLVERVSAR